MSLKELISKTKRALSMGVVLGGLFLSSCTAKRFDRELIETQAQQYKTLSKTELFEIFDNGIDALVERTGGTTKKDPQVLERDLHTFLGWVGYKYGVYLPREHILFEGHNSPSLFTEHNHFNPFTEHIYLKSETIDYNLISTFFHEFSHYLTPSLRGYNVQSLTGYLFDSRYDTVIEGIAECGKRSILEELLQQGYTGKHVRPIAVLVTDLRRSHGFHLYEAYYNTQIGIASPLEKQLVRVFSQCSSTDEIITAVSSSFENHKPYIAGTLFFNVLSSKYGKNTFKVALTKPVPQLVVEVDEILKKYNLFECIVAERQQRKYDYSSSLMSDSEKDSLSVFGKLSEIISALPSGKKTFAFNSDSSVCFENVQKSVLGKKVDISTIKISSADSSKTLLYDVGADGKFYPLLDSFSLDLIEISELYLRRNPSNTKLHRELFSRLLKYHRTLLETLQEKDYIKYALLLTDHHSFLNKEEVKSNIDFLHKCLDQISDKDYCSTFMAQVCKKYAKEWSVKDPKFSYQLYRKAARVEMRSSTRSIQDYIHAYFLAIKHNQGSAAELVLKEVCSDNRFGLYQHFEVYTQLEDVLLTDSALTMDHIKTISSSFEKTLIQSRQEGYFFSLFGDLHEKLAKKWESKNSSFGLYLLVRAARIQKHTFLAEQQYYNAYSYASKHNMTHAAEKILKEASEQTPRFLYHFISKIVETNPAINPLKILELGQKVKEHALKEKSPYLTNLALVYDTVSQKYAKTSPTVSCMFTVAIARLYHSEDWKDSALLNYQKAYAAACHHSLTDAAEKILKESSQKGYTLKK